jgi:hypothetical protein
LNKQTKLLHSLRHILRRPGSALLCGFKCLVLRRLYYTTYTNICTHIHMYMYIYTYVYVYVHIYICICTYIHIYIYTYVHIYICTYVYVHLIVQYAPFVRILFFTRGHLNFRRLGGTHVPNDVDNHVWVDLNGKLHKEFFIVPLSHPTWPMENIILVQRFLWHVNAHAY